MMFNKRELKHINSLDKEWFYEQYLNTDVIFKDYEKITKRQMLEVIYNDILDGEYYLNRSVLKEDIIFLKNNIKNNNLKIIRNHKNSANVIRLYNSFLLFKYDYFSDEYVIPTKVIEIFKNYDLNLLDVELDKFYYFLKGLLLVRGKIYIKEAKEIYENTKIDLDFEGGTSSMVGSILNLDESAYERDDLLIKMSSYQEYYINESYKAPKYSLKEYFNYGKYGLNIDEPSNYKLYKIISKQIDNDYLYYFIENFLNHLNESPGRVHQSTYETLLNASYNNFDKATNLYNELIRILPRWDFKGALHKNVDKEDVRKFYEYISSLNEDEANACKCGSGLDYYECCGNNNKLLMNKAILEENKAKLLYGIINELILYANAKHKKLKFYDYESFIRKLKQVDYIELKDLAFTDKELINDFIIDHKAWFDKNDYEIVEGIKNSYKSYFYALEYIENKLLIYDEENRVKIMLSGIISPLSESISSTVLPSIIETKLIPLSDRITYDIFINETRVKIGPNIMRKIIEESVDLEVITNIKEHKKVYKK